MTCDASDDLRRGHRVTADYSADARLRSEDLREGVRALAE
jgi:hypothetical protein